MGSSADHEVPKIIISGEILLLGHESKEWSNMAEEVKDACEKHGWFMVECDEIPLELQEKVLEVCKEIFDFPDEKKRLYKKATQLEGGFLESGPFAPLYESFGIHSLNEFQALEKLLWPTEGNAKFRKFFDRVTESLLRLCIVLLRMIAESYRLEYYFKEKAIVDGIVYNIRATKYRLPNCNEEGVGLQAHVNKNFFAILFQNSVQGLQGLTRDGDWVSPDIPKGALVVTAGDALQVLSNGRIRALNHRVMITGSQERYSCAFFFIPKKELTLEVPPQLIDENHPPLYRPFVYSEYREKCVYNTDSDAVDTFAGINIL